MHPLGLQLGCVRWLAGVACAIAVAPTAAHAERLVVVRSTADENYLRRRAADAAHRQETYVVMPGRYFAGATYDRILYRTKFEDIARVLAADLRRQDFVPAKSLKSADLLLVVHWGVTMRVDSDYDTGLANLDAVRDIAEQFSQSEQFEAAVASGLEGTAQDAQMVMLGSEAGRRSDLAAQSNQEQLALRFANGPMANIGSDNAHILGLADALNAENNAILVTPERETLLYMTKEERYFIIVMAIDAKTLLGTGKMKRVWTARASIRAAGVNFTEAVDRISQVAGAYFGTRQTDLKFDRVRDRKGKAEPGELIVLGTVDTLPAK